MKIITVDEEIQEITSPDNKIESSVFVNVVEKLMNFLKEFDLELSPRMLNTMIHHKNPNTYIINYAQLAGKENFIELADKINSLEWKNIQAEIKKIKTDKIINSRFLLYFGSPGTGKTTKALEETSAIMGMHDNITPKDLLFDIKFENGDPIFKKTAFTKAMENGTTIILDEINLAPLETLRFLQSVLDNKESIILGDEEIHIKSGFKVIGTMNEIVLNQEYYIPEPLLDRAIDIKRFVLTPESICEFAI